MTLRDLIETASANTVPWTAMLAAVPVAAFVTGRAHKDGEGADHPWRLIYAALVYASTLPGMLAATLTAYAVVMGQNLLDLELGVYLLPVVTMALTLWAIRSRVDFDDVPGFDRIEGLLLLQAISFTVVAFLHKTRILIVFHGSLTSLVLFWAVMFVGMRWAFRRAFGPGSRARP